jgi:hypothetical protein
MFSPSVSVIRLLSFKRMVEPRVRRTICRQANDLSQALEKSQNCFSKQEKLTHQSAVTAIPMR